MTDSSCCLTYFGFQHRSTLICHTISTLTSSFVERQDEAPLLGLAQQLTEHLDGLAPVCRQIWQRMLPRMWTIHTLLLQLQRTLRAAKLLMVCPATSPLLPHVMSHDCQLLATGRSQVCLLAAQAQRLHPHPHTSNTSSLPCKQVARRHSSHTSHLNVIIHVHQLVKQPLGQIGILWACSRWTHHLNWMKPDTPSTSTTVQQVGTSSSRQWMTTTTAVLWAGSKQPPAAQLTLRQYTARRRLVSALPFCRSLMAE